MGRRRSILSLLFPLLGTLACEPARAPIPPNLGLPAELAQRGQDVFYKHGCIDCHVLDGAGGKMGPSLMGIGSRQDEAYIRAYTADPQSVRRSSSMPRAPLTEEELSAVTSYLAAHR